MTPVDNVIRTSYRLSMTNETTAMMLSRFTRRELRAMAAVARMTDEQLPARYRIAARMVQEGIV